jgi:hypothetical protein
MLLKRSAALEKALCVRGAPDASFSPRIGARGCEAGEEADPTDWTSDTGLVPEDNSEPLGEESVEVFASPVVPLVFGGGSIGPDCLAEWVPIGIEVRVNPAADRSPSNPEPARRSPPTEDKVDGAGGDDLALEYVVALLSAELETPWLGDCATLPPFDTEFMLGTESSRELIRSTVESV